MKRSSCPSATGAVIVLALMLNASFTQVVWAQGGSAGTVSSVQGTVTLTRLTATMPAVYGTKVDVGDKLTTAAHSQVTITLNDGTQLQLGDSSTLLVVANSLTAAGVRDHTRIDLLQGLLHSVVRFAPGNAPNYEVHTPNAVAAARGTNYDTNYSKGIQRKQVPGCREFTDVSVFEGLVEVSNPTNPAAGSVMLGQGHKLAVPCSLLSSTMVTTVNAGPAAVTSAATTTTATTVGAGAVLGGAVVGAGVVAGVGATGGLGGGSPDTPSQ